ncbi:MAG TPA: S24 family peptidase [Pedobacter sp.]|uniref:LexA family transcriptional regulator n=1 Tax=Pedobacter sp. TaxID=1411316 RepID=UPI002C4F7EB1|nr:S24 family peptidase [Pedobacter sp.]HMI03052.1 S24 family peptidase [Pedobacter sp.]
MSTENSKVLILNEIKSYYKFKSDVDFSRFLSIAPTTLSSWYKRNTMDYDLIYSKCVDINAEFILSGKGEVKKLALSTKTTNDFSGPSDKKHNLQKIPLYDLEAAAGLVSIFQSSKQNIIDFITIPNMPKCDGAISVTGDSMYPLLKSGDIVLYKILRDLLHGIFFGEMYLLSLDVDDEEMITVKFVQRSELGTDYVKLVSENRHHSPKDVPIKMIRAMALVKASIRINSMN